MSIYVRFRHRFTSLQMDVEFEAPTPGVIALFGPSGCGKSSVVMAVAGLLQPDSCRISLNGTMLADTEAGINIATEHRRIGMVFQDARLFPHMSVLRNLRYGMRRAPAGPIKLDDVVDLLGIAHLLNRRPYSLSGGERQRVAIGRALLTQPMLLAMDEPLASLDGPRKAEILPFLARLKTTLKLPILYVTHSPEELASLADTLILLDTGHVIAKGPLEEIVTRGDLPLAARDDAGTVLTATVVEHDPIHRLTAIKPASMPLLSVPLLERNIGAALRVRIPAREVMLATHDPGATSIHNVLAGRVAGITEIPKSQAALVEISFGATTLLARAPADSVDRLHLTRGINIFALVKAASIEAFPD